MLDLADFLTALRAAVQAASVTELWRFTTAPGGGDGGDALWVARIEDDFDDTAEQPAGAWPGRAKQIANTTITIDAVFDADNIAAARARHTALLDIVTTAAATTRRWRVNAAQLDVDRGAAPRYAASVSVTMFDR